MKRTCKVNSTSNCERKQVRDGLCSTHYERFQVHHNYDTPVSENVDRFEYGRWDHRGRFVHSDGHTESSKYTINVAPTTLPNGLVEQFHISDQGWIKRAVEGYLSGGYMPYSLKEGLRCPDEASNKVLEVLWELGLLEHNTEDDWERTPLGEHIAQCPEKTSGDSALLDFLFFGWLLPDDD